jgi:hypothetical protein
MNESLRFADDLDAGRLRGAGALFPLGKVRPSRWHMQTIN